MNKFITPVSMRVTKKQYNKDLKKPLLDLGYNVTKISNTVNPNESNILNNSTHIDKVDGYLVFFEKGKCTRGNHYIDHYNPKLFLALCAMREGEDYSVGEYVVSLKTYVGKRKIGDIFKIQKVDYDYIKSCHKSIMIYGNKKEFRKATKKELISYLDCLYSSIDDVVIPSQRKKLPENWYIKGSDELHEYLKTINNSYYGAIVSLGYFNNENGWKWDNIFNLVDKYIEISLIDYLRLTNKEEQTPFDNIQVGDTFINQNNYLTTVAKKGKTTLSVFNEFCSLTLPKDFFNHRIKYKIYKDLKIKDKQNYENKNSKTVDESNQRGIRESTTKQESRGLQSGFNKSYSRQRIRIEETYSRRRF